MVKQIARDAVHIKMNNSYEAPLISAYEYCYAAGYALFRMGASQETVKEVGQIQGFEELKGKMKELTEEADAWGNFPQGERLKELITGCRIKNKEIDEDARELFHMGTQGD